MKRSSFALSVALLLVVSSAQADAPPPILLTLTPAKPPTPPLRYQLLPDARLALSGDAAPIYKQVIELLGKKETNQKVDLFDSWASQPVERLPKEDVRKALAEYADVYDLLDKATRCERCDWGLRERLREKGIAVSLEDLQKMRPCARLLTLRARLQMADGHFDQALGTLRSGFAVARHTGESGTLIVFLVGIAHAAMMEEQLDDFIGQPNAPNLYYALTDLPVPLVSMRKAIEGERLMAYGTFPGLAAIGADLNAGNLTDKQLADCAKMLNEINNSKLNVVERTALAAWILNKHEVAKKALIDAGRPRDKVEAMSQLQVALLHALLDYDVALDSMMVWNNLPYWEQAERIGDLKRFRFEERLKDPKSAALPLLPLLIPAIERVTFARVRTDRKIALLRTIEAIRFYAALHDGKLPPSLAAVKEVPIPVDPVTGKDFAYEVNDETATLRAPPPVKEMPSRGNTVTYKLRIRKP